MNQSITVSELNRYVKELFSSDPILRRVTVSGEVSNFTNHIKSGHFYFTLKDQNAAVKAVMFRGNAQRVPFRVENGMKVIVTGSVSVFERDGVYQLYCETMEPDGIGALYLAFEQLKEKLSRMGLFDPAHKKQLPPLPKKIGVVTSKTGAALQDIRNILSRRYPLGTLVVIPALVQGAQAADSIVEGIRMAEDAGDIDLLIVGRGGGSLEDLWCFNEEKVAYAIYNCPIPVISAVGHEIDFTISDFVADLRAPTPSAAAELCAPDIVSLQNAVEGAAAVIQNTMEIRLQSAYERMKGDAARLAVLSPAAQIQRFSGELASKAGRLSLAGDRLIRAGEDSLAAVVAGLEAMSPLKVLTRGYSITYREGKILTSAKGLWDGDYLLTRFADGEITSVVTTEKDEEQLTL